MTLNEIIEKLEPLGNARKKKSNMNQGALEPNFGLTVESMKPLAKELKVLDNCQTLAYELYDTGNYDLMYLAGMIVDPLQMNKEKFNEWLSKGYFYMIGDSIVAVCLSETDIAMEVADEWIESDDELTISAGYSTYSWLLACRDDNLFDKDKIKDMLDQVKAKIHKAPNRAQYAMYYFVYNVGVSYNPLHHDAVKIAESIGEVFIKSLSGLERTYSAFEDIMKEVRKDKIGSKKTSDRC